MRRNKVLRGKEILGEMTRIGWHLMGEVEKPDKRKLHEMYKSNLSNGVQ